MIPIFKNSENKFEDAGEYMLNSSYHAENRNPLKKGNELIGSYFGKKMMDNGTII
jgi:hypothetical protein